MLGNKPPYTTMQQLNLDWVLSKLKTLLRLVPDDGAVGQILRRTRDGAVWSDEQGGGGGGAVESVNGKTGAVVLDAADVGALPDDYTPPVTSVNGQTGAVTVSVPVQSVNGKTGAVVLDADDVGALSEDYTPPVTSVNGQTGAVVIPTGGSPLDAYPVGSIYMSVNSTSPATLFGGTWEQIEDTFLLAAGSSFAAGATGGAATHHHSTAGHTLTVSEIPSHTHGVQGWRYNNQSSGDKWCTSYTKLSDPPSSSTPVLETGGGRAHNHGDTGDASSLPPYLAVYMWKRTA